MFGSSVRSCDMKCSPRNEEICDAIRDGYANDRTWTEVHLEIALWTDWGNSFSYTKFFFFFADLEV